MDVQTTCLGVLAMGPASGYEIRKEFEDGPFSHFAEGGFGSIYPALGRLTDQGLVTFQHTAQEKRPDKKIYQITQSGYDALFQTLATTDPGEDKYKSDFLFILFFAERLPEDHIARVIDARIAWYSDRLELLSSKQCERGTAPLDIDASDTREHAITVQGHDLVRGYGVAVYQAALDYLIANRETLIDLARSNAARTHTEQSSTHRADGVPDRKKGKVEAA